MLRRLGCLTGAGLIAAAVTLLLSLGVIAVFGGQWFSPGPLNAQAGATALGGVTSHAATGGRCEACHPAPWEAATLSDRCLACHTAVADELRDPTSLHGALQGTQAEMACRGCHTEHRGATASLTVLDPKTFPHDAVGYTLAGHVKLADGRPFACADCHTEKLATFDATVCADCHRKADPAYIEQHVADFGAACLGCHDGADRYSKRRFDHNRLPFPLTGKHAGARCASCHVNARTAADLQAAPQTCVGCHQEDDKHRGAFGTDCAACHQTDTWAGATFDHSKSAFPLTGKHVDVQCERCHVNQVFKGAPTACIGCHQQDDKHKGALGTDCAACHRTDTWAGATFDHSKSAFPLTGKHVDVQCERCHVNQVFKGAPTACVGCHQQDDKHKGAFGADCAACHRTDTWAGATFDHNKSAFPLTGKHVDVQCERCHVNQVFKGTPTACVGCHQKDDKHKGALGTDCAACHQTDTWAGATFDHSRSAFPLTGKHVDVQCERCHVNQVFKGAPTACIGCHQDPAYHLGVFGTACADCHTADAWRPARYNRPHTFPLDHGESGVSPCKTCHPDQLKTYTCYGCHEHTPAKIERKHVKEGISDFANCVKCHPTGREKEGKKGGGDD